MERTLIRTRGDQEACHFDNGIVTTPKGFKEAYEAYSEGGWSGLTGDTNYGGQGMPKVLSAMIRRVGNCEVHVCENVP